MRNHTLFCALLPALILAMCQAESHSARLTAFGKNQNQNNHKNSNKNSLGLRTRECKQNSDCGGIQNTTCMSDPRDNKMRCLCFDSSPPINGACPNRPRALHATCTSDSQCSEGLQCKAMNPATEGQSNATKICMCPEEIAGGQCKDGASSISANFLSGLIATLTVLSFNYWYPLTYRPF